MSVGPPDLDWGLDFAIQDRPSEDFIEAVRRRHPTEREIDATLTRKLRRRDGSRYRRPPLEDIAGRLGALLASLLPATDHQVRDLHWFTGGVSKIQVGFTLDRDDGRGGRRGDHLVVRMDPSEGSNATSRAREAELLRLMRGVVPVPDVFHLDADGTWFPEPALIYSFVEGVTKPTTTRTGRISGLGTDFGPELRERLGAQYVEHLARIHTLDVSGRAFDTLDVPSVGTDQAARWAVNHALRTWEEDRGEDSPLMEVAASWLLRNLPELDVAGIVHGDFRSGNFLFDEGTSRILGWLDWERGLVGDRHRDLAWITLPTMGHYDENGRYLVCGLVPLDEFFDRYTAASGLTVDRDRLRFYQILCCFVIIVSTMASNFRIARLGRSHQDILLTRVEGMVPVISRVLSDLLREAP